MLNSISRACILQALRAGSLYVFTTISVVRSQVGRKADRKEEAKNFKRRKEEECLGVKCLVG